MGTLLPLLVNVGGREGTLKVAAGARTAKAASTTLSPRPAERTRLFPCFMSPKPTPFSAARIHETVQEILAAGVLPPIVQAGHPVLRQQAAAFDGQLDSCRTRAADRT